jgi:hypothetical protein
MSQRLGGNMLIGKCVLMILGPAAFSVQATVSFIIRAIAFMGSSVSKEGTGMSEVCKAVNSKKGTLKKMFFCDSSLSRLTPLATCHMSSCVKVVPHLGYVIIQTSSGLGLKFQIRSAISGNLADMYMFIGSDLTMLVLKVAGWV